MRKLQLVALLTSMMVHPSLAATVPLASLMDGTSNVREDALTGSQSQISFGDGGPGDADGAYDISDLSVRFGTKVDIFPNENNFSVGTLVYDDAAATGYGVEIVGVTALNVDLTNDISNLPMILAGNPGSFVFGDPDGGDTVTLTDGVVTGINVDVEVGFTVDFSAFGQAPVTWAGTFSVEGNELSLAIDDTMPVVTPFGVLQSNLIWDLRGSVNAVVDQSRLLAGIDDFSDGSPLNWTKGSQHASSDLPANIPDGGPSGGGDNYLSYTADTSVRMIIFNRDKQWSGDYVSAGVKAIQMDVRNDSDSEFQLRMGFNNAVGRAGTWWVSGEAVVVPASSEWVTVVIPVSQSALTRVFGSDDYTSVMSDVRSVRILSSALPDYRGDRIDGTLCLDNISVSAEPAPYVPEAGSLMVSFTGGLSVENFTGPDSISPFVAGNALSAFIASTNELDVLRVDGQFYLEGWDGTDGTFTTNVTPGAKFFLHSPLLERLETDTWRAEGASNHGTQTGAGADISQRKKFLLPTASTYGSASVTVENGVPTSLTYALDFSTEGVPGFEGTALEVVEFQTISLDSGNAVFGAPETYTIGTDDDDAPYGFNTVLTAGSHPAGVLSGTVINTTRGMLRNEINNNTDEAGGNTANISSNGRLDGAVYFDEELNSYRYHPSAASPAEGEVYLADPFANESGVLTVFTATGLDVSVSAEPVLPVIDQWTLDNFGANPGEEAGSDGNPDLDDLNNLLEFAFGTDPNAADSTGLVVTDGQTLTTGTPVLATSTVGNGVNFTVRFIRRVDAESVGLAYSVQFSRDVADWQTSDQLPILVAVEGNYEVVEVDFPYALSDGRKPQFFRVLAELSN